MNTQEEINKLQQKLQRIVELKKSLDSFVASIEIQIENLQYYAEAEKDLDKSIVDMKVAIGEIPELAMPQRVALTENTRVKRRGRRKGAKTKSQQFEELFKEHGPMHVTEIVPVAEARGIEFVGKKEKKLQVRDNLFGSKKFHNFGGNVWGLIGQTLPEKYRQNTLDDQLESTDETGLWESIRASA